MDPSSIVTVPPPPAWLLALALPAMPGGPGGSDDDAECMRRIGEGDAAALAALYDRHAGSVFAVCLKMLDRADAEEILGDVFWDVWQRPGRYDPSRGAPLAWLTVLARSRAADRLRAGGRRRKLLDVGQDTVRDTLHEGGRPADPFEETAGGEVRQRVGDALSALDAKQREAIELSFYGAMSHSEIATALGEPLGTVKTRIRQGLIRLRDSLATHYGAGESA